MAKRKKKPTREEREEREARYEATTRLLEERIAYHQARALEERKARKRSR